MLTNDRNAYRKVYFTTWQKYLKKMPLEILEAQVLAVMLAHPEYHYLLASADKYQDQEFSIEENPFFHMSLHIAIAEQIRTNRPNGITLIHQQLNAKLLDEQTAEHQMIGCLIEMLNKGQVAGEMPKEDEYLLNLQKLL